MVATVEMYEPRMPSWVMVEPMNHTRVWIPFFGCAWWLDIYIWWGER